MEKQLKLVALTGIIIASFAVAYYFLFTAPQQSQTQIEEAPANQQADEFLGDTKDDLTFDIDVSALSYQLPPYTKICLPETKQQCGEVGCESVKPTVFVLYDENNSIVYRCDNKPCDGYEVVRVESGLFTVLQPVEPRVFSVKLSFDNKYVETVGFGLDTLVSHGICK